MKRYRVVHLDARAIDRVTRRWHLAIYGDRAEYGRPSPDTAAEALASALEDEASRRVVAEFDAVDGLAAHRRQVAQRNAATSTHWHGVRPPSVWAVVDTLPNIDRIGAGYYPTRWEWERETNRDDVAVSYPAGPEVHVAAPSPEALGPVFDVLDNVKAAMRYARKVYGNNPTTEQDK